MITDSSVVEIGHTVKPHGINGELVAVVDPDIDLDQLPCLIMKIDGIYVPFFISSWRSRGSESVLVALDGVATETEAEKYAGLTLYADAGMLPEQEDDTEDDGFYAADFIGWTVTDRGATVGTVTDYDDSTANLVFTLATPDGGELLIPVADDLIVSVDPVRRVLDMDLPVGLE